jgi:hypothetical protein
MLDTSKIDHGIAAHARWKYRLMAAIETGKSEWTVSGMRSDDQCEFGKWFLALPLSDRLSEHWRKIKDLHTEFHKTASEVLELALAGRKEEAEAAMSLGSRFASISSDLTMAMTAWKEASSEG